MRFTAFKVILSSLIFLLVRVSLDAGEALLDAPPRPESVTGGDTDAPPSTAQLFDSMDYYRRPSPTVSEEARPYFEQGLIWVYAFNHDEAIKCFRHAAELDDDCAITWWGIALCEGPNYNDAVMTDERSSAAWNALQKAMERIDNTSPVERSLISALADRYAKPWPEDRADLDRAYAEAMAKVWHEFPSDPDVGTLYADSIMVLNPWKLYTLDQQPIDGTSTILEVLTRVLRMAPNHPGANHLYIHAVEPSNDPAQGLNAAERLKDLVPASGHLLHMPSHIYVQTGRWNDAIIQNEKALRADARYRELSPKQGIQHMYMVHNAHMLAFAAMMSGREREAMRAARQMWSNIPDDALREVGPLFDLWMCSVYDVQKRFGRWDDILAEPSPPSFLPVTLAIWRAHRAIAYAAKKDFAHAEREYLAFQQAVDAVPEDHVAITDPAHSILAVSNDFIAGEIALQKGDWESAAERLEKAADAEDALSYGEPPQWLQPIRHTLGAVYLTSGRYQEAERVYVEDLAKWPENGWSLYGLSRALQLQGKTEEATAVKKRYEKAWARADEMTETSCKCIPKS